MSLIRCNIDGKEYYIISAMLDSETYNTLDRLRVEYEEEYGPVNMNRLVNAFIKYVMKGRNYKDMARIIHSIMGDEE